MPEPTSLRLQAYNFALIWAYVDNVVVLTGNPGGLPPEDVKRRALLEQVIAMKAILSLSETLGNKVHEQIEGTLQEVGRKTLEQLLKAFEKEPEFRIFADSFKGGQVGLGNLSEADLLAILAAERRHGYVPSVDSPGKFGAS